MIRSLSLGLVASVALISLGLGSASAKDIQSVYWVNSVDKAKCFVTAEPVSVRLDNGPNAKLTLRKASVLPKRQNCLNMVDGAYVVLHGKIDAPISFVVNYTNGATSRHTYHP